MLKCEGCRPCCPVHLFASLLPSLFVSLCIISYFSLRSLSHLALHSRVLHNGWPLLSFTNREYTCGRLLKTNFPSELYVRTESMSSTHWRSCDLLTHGIVTVLSFAHLRHRSIFHACCLILTVHAQTSVSSVQDRGIDTRPPFSWPQVELVAQRFGDFQLEKQQPRTHLDRCGSVQLTPAVGIGLPCEVITL